MTRYRVDRLEPKGWDTVAEITAPLSQVFAIAEYASMFPSSSRARALDAATGEELAVFDAGQCLRLNGRVFP